MTAREMALEFFGYAVEEKGLPNTKEERMFWMVELEIAANIILQHIPSIERISLRLKNDAKTDISDGA